MLLSHLLENSAKKTPGKTAIRAGKNSITYKDLNDASSRLASLLLQCGSKQGDLIPVYLDKSISAIMSIFAILKAGAAYIPLDTKSPLNRVQYILDNSNAKFLITESSKIPTISCLHRQHPFSKVILVDNKNARNIEGQSDTVNITSFDPHDTSVTGSFVTHRVSAETQAYVLYTSGSTGYPKGVVLSHRNALSFINWAYSYFGISDDDVFSSHAPLHFDLSIFDIFVSIKAGAEICLLPQSISSFPVSLGKFIETNNITTWYSVPSVLIDMLTHGNLSPLNLDHVRRIIYAGEPFPVKYLKELMTQIPEALYYNLYGPTETNVITFYQIDASIQEVNGDIPIGRACPYANIRVITEDGRIASEGEKGELLVNGDSLMIGYLNKPDLTSQTIKQVYLPNEEAEKYYFTGDIVEVLDGDNLRFVGRKDHMVKIKGFRVEIEEIEANLMRLDCIKECIVTAVERENYGSVLKAFVVLKEKGIDPMKIRTFLKDYVPQYMIPEEIRIVDSLKKNSRGKTERRILS